MTAEPFLDARGIGKTFHGRHGSQAVLRDVSLSVAKGEFVSIVGAMGSGKSTLLNILSGVTPTDTGTVSVDGHPVVGVRDDAAVVFQNYSLLPWLTALENVRLAVAAATPGISGARARERAREALEQVGLGNAVARRPSQLSGGMRQRVAIARAFATRPSLLFLDEPFGALDALTREMLQQDLATLCASAGRPVTVIMITNSVEEALLLSDRILPILPGPPATLGEAIPLTRPRPRTASDLAHDDAASHVRAHVIARLTTSAARRPARLPRGITQRTEVR
jgi:ABC-type nitrate/sulfonate/bicarbonate transport system ATPase subunit